VAVRAAERRVEVFALTDHDSCEGWPEAQVASARCIRGVELSCDEDGRTVHVLAFDGGGDWSALEQRLGEVRAARQRRLRVMAARLAQRGIPIDVETLLEAAGNRSVGRPDLAKVMVEKGVVQSLKEAFSRHLYDGGPVDVAQRELPMQEALALGRAVGARMALAHPHVYGAQSAEMVKRYRGEGLTGLEAYYGGYDLAERRRWAAVARDLGVVCTGGSDWHQQGDVEPGVDLPETETDRLMEWLQCA
jgi:predicted metal-dependent phosphoesterase TrpH